MLWTGSINADSIIDTKNAAGMIGMINTALDTANASQIQTSKQDLQLMNLMVKTMEGTAGVYEVFESYQTFFQDEGTYMDYEEFEEQYKFWSFKRKGYGLKTGSFDQKTYRNWRERGVDLDQMVQKRTIEAIATYNNVYKPNIIFETLLTVPKDGAGADYPFGKVFGAIRNYKIQESKVVNLDSSASAGEVGSPIRNNWRAIKENTGLSPKDINFYKEYMGDIEGINEENLVVFGTSSAIGEFKNLYSDFSPTTEEIISNGVPTGVQAWTVDGLTLIAVKSPFPKKTLAFINPDASVNGIISKLVSNVPEYQGVSIEFPDNGVKFISNGKDFQGSNLIINPEGYHMTGVLDVLWVDIDPGSASSDRLMQPAGFTKISNKKADLRRKWNKTVNKRVAK